jgi:hypothetical protein
MWVAAKKKFKGRNNRLQMAKKAVILLYQQVIDHKKIKTTM